MNSISRSLPTVKPITIAIVDDHELVLDGLKARLERMGGYEVVLASRSGEAFINALADLPSVDIALVDLQMPGMDGFEVLEHLQRVRPEIRTVSLSFSNDPLWVRRAMHAGARGHSLKGTAAHMLDHTLQQVMATGYHITDLIRESMVVGTDATAATPKKFDTTGIPPREMEFLLLVCAEAEYTYEQIADRMGVHRRTVDNFRIALFEKFDIKSKTGLVLFAMRWRLIA